MKGRSWFALPALLSMVATPAGAIVQAPFTLDDNLVHLSASINGVPISAVLDSGTSQVLVDRSVAARMGLASGDAVGSGLGGGAGAQPVFPLPLKSVKVGPVDLEDVHGFAMDLEPFTTSAGFQIDTLLGGPVFNTGVVRVDYRKRQVSFLAAEKTVACANPIPIQLIAGVPVVTVALRADATAAPTPLHLVVDLGTRHFAVMLGGSFLNSEAGRRLLLAGSPAKIGTGAGGEIKGATAEIEALTIGDKTFHHLRIALTREVKAFETGVVDGTLGVPLWVGGEVTFDYPHQRICISPGGG